MDKFENVTYQVWVLGYDVDGNITDYDHYLKGFSDADDAVTYAENLNLDFILEKTEQDGNPVPEEVRQLWLQVETVVDYGDWEENEDTIYENSFDIEED